MRDLYVGILEHKQVASKKGKNVERAGFSVGIVEHCVRECRGMESIGLLHLTLSSLPVKWHHRQLQGPLYNIGLGTFLKQDLNIIEVKLQISSNSRRQSCLSIYIEHDSHHFHELVISIRLRIMLREWVGVDLSESYE